MALTLIVQTADGVAGANVYSDVAAAEAYLADMEYAAFIAKADATKDRIAIEATRLCEGEVESRVDGYVLDDDQGLLWPREDATDSRSRLIEGIPVPYTEGIILMMEHIAAAPRGRAKAAGPQTGTVLAERAEGWSAVYSKRDLLFHELYPDVWALLRQSFPPGIRSKRA